MNTEIEHLPKYQATNLSEFFYLIEKIKEKDFNKNTNGIIIHVNNPNMGPIFCEKDELGIPSKTETNVYKSGFPNHDQAIFLFDEICNLIQSFKIGNLNSYLIIDTDMWIYISKIDSKINFNVYFRNTNIWDEISIKAPAVQLLKMDIARELKLSDGELTMILAPPNNNNSFVNEWKEI